MIAIATGGAYTVAEILELPVAQMLQLRTLGLMRQNVKMRPAGGGKLRNQVREILGDHFDDWIMDE